MQTATEPRWIDLLATRGISGADTAPYMSPGIQDSSTTARVTESADGVSLRTLWQEFSQVTELWNEHRLALADLISFRTTVLADAVPARITSDSFEIAAEHTVPKAMSQDDFILLGYTYEDHDLRSAFTWKFLRDSTAEQIRSFYNRALEADAKLQSGLLFGRLLDPTPTVNEAGHPVLGLYSGDGFVPPSFYGKSFAGSHTHYLVSEANVVDSGDLVEQFELIREHGYGLQAGSQLITFVNPIESEAIQGFRAGEESRPSGPVSKFTFLPSASAPPRIEVGQIIGRVAPTDFGGLPIAGSYGPTWIAESPFVPAGYVITVASGGSSSPLNPIGMREHPKPQYQGLRQIPGNWSDYPLIDAFYTRGIGCGTRHRGAAAVTQIKASGTYDIPEIPK